MKKNCASGLISKYFNMMFLTISWVKWAFRIELPECQSQENRVRDTHDAADLLAISKWEKVGDSGVSSSFLIVKEEDGAARQLSSKQKAPNLPFSDSARCEIVCIKSSKNVISDLLLSCTNVGRQCCFLVTKSEQLPSCTT